MMNTIRFISIMLSGALLIPTLHAADSAQTSYEYHTFATCQEFEDTLKKVLPTTNNSWNRGGIMYEMTPTPMTTTAVAKGADASVPKSDTNIQVKGIDEADTVKTDGNYLYSFQDGESAIVILDAKNLKRIKSIKIPKNYSGVNFYIQKNKLVLTASKTLQSKNSWTYWYNYSQKSIIAIYDITTPDTARLLRNIEVDGYLSDTRLADNGMMTAVVATSYWMPPIYRYWDSTSKMVRPTFDYSTKNLMPRISDQQFTKEKSVVSTRSIGDCSGMSSILPSKKTLSKYTINPTLTSILRFDIKVANGKIDSEVVLSEAGQIHVTKDAVYLTANMWQQNASSPCPPNARCATPLIWNPGTSSTLVHKFNITNANTRYSYSKEIVGMPLSQYSMDEDTGGNFRIVTSISSWSGGVNNSSTNLSIIGSSGNLIGSLSGIAVGENFQSSRFIGNRLYLVTFEQIDPLFVIDLSDAKNPKILGELKIPGYSTYLHPYDADRLIGIGYDTKTNKWGGTQNTGIKVDLYNVRDVKNPTREASLTLGDMGSSSDALWNPKAFVWYKEKNLLLLPVTLMTSAGNTENEYLSKSAFQGMVGLSILPNSISEKFRITHLVPPANIDQLWKKDCAQYEKINTSYKPYIPEYCKVGATVDMYLANNIWNYSSDFISRVLYVGENLYTIGTSRIQSQTFANPTVPTAVQKFKTRTYFGYPMPVDIMPVMAQ